MVVTANAAIYLPVESPDLTKVFPGAKSDRGILKHKASWFATVLNGDTVRFNVLTFDGPVTAVGEPDELAAGGLPLSPLFFAGNDVITQLRMV